LYYNSLNYLNDLTQDEFGGRDKVDKHF